MTTAPSPPFSINNRTLAFVRWVVIAGQILAVLMGTFLLGIKLPHPYIWGCIGALVVVNLLSRILHRRRPVRSWVATLYIAFDVLQFSAMLYLTGGFENPLSLMLIAPVAVAAAVLTLWQTILITLLTIVCLTAISSLYFPLDWPGGHVRITPMYLLGEQVALVLGIAFVASYVWRMSYETRRIQNALQDTRIQLDRQRRLSALGAQAAAAAHELGSPLGTIAIIAKDLQREFAGDPDMKDDLKLLVEQSERCREILKDLGRNPERSEDPLLTRIPIASLLTDLTHQYHHENPAIRVEISDTPDIREEMIDTTPELTRALGNVIQNAIEHAQTLVTIEIAALPASLQVIIHNDGNEFPAAILARVGEPYLTAGRTEGKGNMGLGLFITRTLLENLGGKIHIRNHPQGGAEVTVLIPRAMEDKNT